MSTTHKLFAAAAGGLVALAAFLWSFQTLSATPSLTCRDPLAPATSTLAFLTPGTGTTTLTIDTCQQADYALNSAHLLFQYTASSSNPTLRMRVEYSQDKQDWYPASTALNGTATTTIMSGEAADYRFTLSTTGSTTDGFPGSGNATRLHQSLSISTPTRYVRVVFFVPAGGGNGGLWAELVGKREL